MDAVPPKELRKKSKRSPRWERKLKYAVGELAAIVGAVLVSCASVATGASPAWVTLVIVASGSAAAWTVWRSHAARHADLVAYRSQCEAEIEAWHRRWQSLQQEAGQRARALSIMRDGVIMLSESAEILLINPAAYFLLALSPDRDLHERPFNECVRTPELRRAVAAARAGEGTQKLLIEITYGETVRPVKVRVDRFDTAGDRSLLMTLRDETEAHRIEEVRREFVANISHELKTPLAAIKGYAETVEMAIEDDPEAAVRFVTQIKSQCLRLERLIADMMRLARAQSGRAQMRIGSVSLGDVLAESIKAYEPVAEASSIELKLNRPAGDARLQSDAEAILTIANNLIGNAIAHTPQGGQVRVSCQQESGVWSIQVEDTGVGIPESEQQRIFERFYRVEKGRSSKDGGTGIGLSIVKNLTVALGGEIRLRSKPGEGATFEVRLPVDNQTLDKNS